MPRVLCSATTPGSARRCLAGPGQIFVQRTPESPMTDSTARRAWVGKPARLKLVVIGLFRVRVCWGLWFSAGARLDLVDLGGGVVAQAAAELVPGGVAERDRVLRVEVARHRRDARAEQRLAALPHLRHGASRMLPETGTSAFRCRATQQHPAAHCCRNHACHHDELACTCTHYPMLAMADLTACNAAKQELHDNRQAGRTAVRVRSCMGLTARTAPASMCRCPFTGTLRIQRLRPLRAQHRYTMSGHAAICKLAWSICQPRHHVPSWHCRT